jgi:hypothetical protein
MNRIVLVVGGALASACALFTASNVLAAEYRIKHYDNSVDAVILEGEITKGDAVAFAAALHNAAIPGHKIIVALNSIGGNWTEANRMAIWIRDYRRKGWHVGTGVHGICASSCVTLFAMGERKYMSQGSIVNVHTVVSTINGDESTMQEAMDESLKWGRFLKQAGAPDSVVRKLIATSSREGADLTTDELKEWGVTFLGSLDE